jgi:hypothetical protein
VLVLVDSALVAAVAALRLCAGAAIVAGCLFLVGALFLTPGWMLRSAAGEARARIATGRSTLASAASEARAMEFCRRLRGGSWSLGDVRSGLVFLLISSAALLSVLVAGNVLGLRRPEVAEAWLPWLLGLALLASLTEAWTRPDGERWLAVAVVLFALAALVLITVLKVEATIIPATTYVKHHPLKEALLYPGWIAVELTLFLGAAVLGREGVDNGIRVGGWSLGLVGEAVLRALICLINATGYLLEWFLEAIHLGLGLVFLPAALVWEALRRRAGTDLDGNSRLPALPGEPVG